MVIEKIRRCSLCKKEGCNGAEYYVSRFDVQLKTPLPTIIVCSSQVQEKIDGPVYREVVGHGLTNYWQAHKVKQPTLI